jgi:hypothetical protein
MLKKIAGGGKNALPLLVLESIDSIVYSDPDSANTLKIEHLRLRLENNI